MIRPYVMGVIKIHPYRFKVSVTCGATDLFSYFRILKDVFSLKDIRAKKKIIIEKQNRNWKEQNQKLNESPMS